MVTAWKIRAARERRGSNFTHKEYFLVAAPERFSALARLRKRRPDLVGSEFTVDGEADPRYAAWLAMRDGDVLSVFGAPEGGAVTGDQSPNGGEEPETIKGQE
jgi:hypothetical protein